MAEGGDASWRRRPNDRVKIGVGKIVGWVVAPALAAFCLVFLVQDIGPAWDAAQGRGMHGTMTVTEQDCGGRGGCDPVGPFVSDDGSLRLERVRMPTPPHGWEIGDRLRAICPASREPPVVYREHGSYDWVLMAGLIGAALVVLGVWLSFLLSAIENRRPGRGEQAGWS